MNTWNDKMITFNTQDFLKGEKYIPKVTDDKYISTSEVIAFVVISELFQYFGQDTILDGDLLQKGISCYMMTESGTFKERDLEKLTLDDLTEIYPLETRASLIFEDKKTGKYLSWVTQAEAYIASPKSYTKGILTFSNGILFRHNGKTIQQLIDTYEDEEALVRDLSPDLIFKQNLDIELQSISSNLEITLSNKIQDSLANLKAIDSNVDFVLVEQKKIREALFNARELVKDTIISNFERNKREKTLSSIDDLLNNFEVPVVKNKNQQGKKTDTKRTLKQEQPNENNQEHKIETDTEKQEERVEEIESQEVKEEEEKEKRKDSETYEGSDDKKEKVEKEQENREEEKEAKEEEKEEEEEVEEEEAETETETEEEEEEKEETKTEEEKREEEEEEEGKKEEEKEETLDTEEDKKKLIEDTEKEQAETKEGEKGNNETISLPENSPVRNKLVQLDKVSLKIDTEHMLLPEEELSQLKRALITSKTNLYNNYNLYLVHSHQRQNTVTNFTKSQLVDKLVQGNENFRDFLTAVPSLLLPNQGEISVTLKQQVDTSQQPQYKVLIKTIPLHGVDPFIKKLMTGYKKRYQTIRKRIGKQLLRKIKQEHLNELIYQPRTQEEFEDVSHVLTHIKFIQISAPTKGGILIRVSTDGKISEQVIRNYFNLTEKGEKLISNTHCKRIGMLFFFSN